MDINRGGTQGFMPEKSFNGEQVCAVLIKVCAKGMTECVAGKAFRPAKPAFMGMDVAGKIKSINRSGRIMLLWEKPAGGAAIGKPVLCQYSASFLPKMKLKLNG